MKCFRLATVPLVMSLLLSSSVQAADISLPAAVTMAPCDPTDAECLIDLSLRQTLAKELAERKLEGCKEDLDHTQEDLQQAESGPSKVTIFVLGGIVFLAFTGMFRLLFKDIAK